MESPSVLVESTLSLLHPLSNENGDQRKKSNKFKNKSQLAKKDSNNNTNINSSSSSRKKKYDSKRSNNIDIDSSGGSLGAAHVSFVDFVSQIPSNTPINNRKSGFKMIGGRRGKERNNSSHHKRTKKTTTTTTTVTTTTTTTTKSTPTTSSSSVVKSVLRPARYSYLENNGTLLTPMNNTTLASGSSASGSSSSSSLGGTFGLLSSSTTNKQVTFGSPISDDKQNPLHHEESSLLSLQSPVFQSPPRRQKEKNDDDDEIITSPTIAGSFRYMPVKSSLLTSPPSSRHHRRDNNTNTSVTMQHKQKEQQLGKDLFPDVTKNDIEEEEPKKQAQEATAAAAAASSITTRIKQRKPSPLLLSVKKRKEATVENNNNFSSDTLINNTNSSDKNFYNNNSKKRRKENSPSLNSTPTHNNKSSIPTPPNSSSSSSTLSSSSSLISHIPVLGSLSLRSPSSTKSVSSKATGVKVEKTTTTKTRKKKVTSPKRPTKKRKEASTSTTKGGRGSSKTPRTKKSKTGGATGSTCENSNNAINASTSTAAADTKNDNNKTTSIPNCKDVVRTASGEAQLQFSPLCTNIFEKHKREFDKSLERLKKLDMFGFFLPLNSSSAGNQHQDSLSQEEEEQEEDVVVEEEQDFDHTFLIIDQNVSRNKYVINRLEVEKQRHEKFLERISKNKNAIDEEDKKSNDTTTATTTLSSSSDEGLLKLVNFKAVNWSLFRQDILSMCDACISKVPEEYNKHPTSKESRLLRTANKIKDLMETIYEKNSTRHEEELDAEDIKARMTDSVVNNKKAAMQINWRKTPFPERMYKRLSSTNVICSGLSPVDQRSAENELQTALPNSFVGLPYDYDDVGQSENWMKSIVGGVMMMSHEKKATAALAKDGGVVRAQVETTMQMLLNAVQDRVMTQEGVLERPELISRNWCEDLSRHHVDTTTPTTTLDNNKKKPELSEQPVWGIDSFTRGNVVACLETHEEYKEHAEEFLEKWLLPAINACPVELAHDLTAAARILEGSSAPTLLKGSNNNSNISSAATSAAACTASSSSTSNTMTFLSEAFSDKVSRGPHWLSGAARQLRLACEILGDTAFRVHPKGHGAVVLKKDGIKADTLVTYYRGEVYPPWRWGEKQDAIEEIQEQFGLRPVLPDFYNMVLERPRVDPRGYGLLFVDASRKAGMGSSLSHSCDPTCQVHVAAQNGKLCLAMTTVRDVEQGEELTFDYCAVTESLNEYNSAICLCGHTKCRWSFLHHATADQYQQVLSRNSPIAVRVASLIRASNKKVMSNEDNKALERHGFHTATFGALSFFKKEKRLDQQQEEEEEATSSIENVPVWLRTYAADVLRYIEYERRGLPSALICNTLINSMESDNNKNNNKKQQELLQSMKQKNSNTTGTSSNKKNAYFYFLRVEYDSLEKIVRARHQAQQQKEGGDQQHLISMNQQDLSVAIKRLAGETWKKMDDSRKEIYMKFCSKESPALDATSTTNSKNNENLEDSSDTNNNTTKKGGGRKKVNKKKSGNKNKKGDEKRASNSSDDSVTGDENASDSGTKSVPISFRDADIAGRTLLEQRILSLVQILSRCGRILARHRDSHAHDDEKDKDDDIHNTNTNGGKRCSNQTIHSPISILSDKEVVKWMWSTTSEDGVLAPLLKFGACDPCVSPSLKSSFDQFRKKYKLLGIYCGEEEEEPFDRSTNHDSTTDSTNIEVPSDTRARKMLKEALLEMRQILEDGIEKSDIEVEEYYKNKRKQNRKTNESQHTTWIPEEYEKHKYKLETAADLILLYANTNTFFKVPPYIEVESSPIEVYARELGNQVPRSILPPPQQQQEGTTQSSGTTAVGKKPVKNSRKTSRQTKKEYYDPEDVVGSVTRKYSSSHVFIQLLQWYNSGIGTRSDIPEMSGCVHLPRMEDCFINKTVLFLGSQSKGSSSKVGGSSNNKNKDTYYCTHIRRKLAEWIVDWNARSNPWSENIRQFFSCPFKMLSESKDDTDFSKKILGSPVLDFLMQGDDTNINNVFESLEKSIKGKVTVPKNSNNHHPDDGDTGIMNTDDSEVVLESTVDMGKPAQAKVTWVQCENPECQKWRKIPFYVDVDLLPAKFYCKDNLWSDKNSCEASEDEWENDKDEIIFDDEDNDSSIDYDDGFKLNTRFDVKNSMLDKYIEAIVVQRDFKSAQKRIKFHFPELKNSKTDEWVNMDSNRIKPHGKYTGIKMIEKPVAVQKTGKRRSKPSNHKPSSKPRKSQEVDIIIEDIPTTTQHHLSMSTDDGEETKRKEQEDSELALVEKNHTTSTTMQRDESLGGDDSLLLDGSSNTIPTNIENNDCDDTSTSEEKRVNDEENEESCCESFEKLNEKEKEEEESNKSMIDDMIEEEEEENNKHPSDLLSSSLSFENYVMLEDQVVGVTTGGGKQHEHDHEQQDIVNKSNLNPIIENSEKQHIEKSSSLEQEEEEEAQNDNDENESTTENEKNNIQDVQTTTTTTTIKNVENTMKQNQSKQAASPESRTQTQIIPSSRKSSSPSPSSASSASSALCSIHDILNGAVSSSTFSTEEGETLALFKTPPAPPEEEQQQNLDTTTRQVQAQAKVNNAAAASSMDVVNDHTSQQENETLDNIDGTLSPSLQQTNQGEAQQEDKNSSDHLVPTPVHRLFSSVSYPSQQQQQHSPEKYHKNMKGNSDQHTDNNSDSEESFTSLDTAKLMLPTPTYYNDIINNNNRRSREKKLHFSFSNLKSLQKQHHITSMMDSSSNNNDDDDSNSNDNSFFMDQDDVRIEDNGSTQQQQHHRDPNNDNNNMPTVITTSQEDQEEESRMRGRGRADQDQDSMLVVATSRSLMSRNNTTEQEETNKDTDQDDDELDQLQRRREEQQQQQQQQAVSSYPPPHLTQTTVIPYPIFLKSFELALQRSIENAFTPLKRDFNEIVTSTRTSIENLENSLFAPLKKDLGVIVEQLGQIIININEKEEVQQQGPAPSSAAAAATTRKTGEEAPPPPPLQQPKKISEKEKKKRQRPKRLDIKNIDARNKERRSRSKSASNTFASAENTPDGKKQTKTKANSSKGRRKPVQDIYVLRNNSATGAVHHTAADHEESNSRSRSIRSASVNTNSTRPVQDVYVRQHNHHQPLRQRRNNDESYMSSGSSESLSSGYETNTTTIRSSKYSTTKKRSSSRNNKVMQDRRRRRSHRRTSGSSLTPSLSISRSRSSYNNNNRGRGRGRGDSERNRRRSSRSISTMSRRRRSSRSRSPPTRSATTTHSRSHQRSNGRNNHSRRSRRSRSVESHNNDEEIMSIDSSSSSLSYDDDDSIMDDKEIHNSRRRGRSRSRSQRRRRRRLSSRSESRKRGRHDRSYNNDHDYSYDDRNDDSSLEDHRSRRSTSRSHNRSSTRNRRGHQLLDYRGHDNISLQPPTSSSRRRSRSSARITRSQSLLSRNSHQSSLQQQQRRRRQQLNKTEDDDDDDEEESDSRSRSYSSNRRGISRSRSRTKDTHHSHHQSINNNNPLSSPLVSPYYRETKKRKQKQQQQQVRSQNNKRTNNTFTKKTKSSTLSRYQNIYNNADLESLSDTGMDNREEEFSDLED